MEEKGGEGAMHASTGTDALDDLLTQVATLGEVKGAGLIRLLGKVAVANICAGFRRCARSNPRTIASPMVPQPSTVSV